MEDIGALKTEVAKADYNGMTDAQIAAALNVKDQTKLTAISSAELLAWAGANGRYVKVENAANATLPAVDDPTYTTMVALKSIAKVAEKLLSRDATSLDLALADRAAMVDALVSAGVIDSGDKDALTALATVSVSKGELFGFNRPLDAADIATARNA